jgi:DNA repair protein RadC
MSSLASLDPPRLEDGELLSVVLQGCEGRIPCRLPRPGSSSTEIEQVHGLSPSAADRLSAALELGRRSLLGESCLAKALISGEHVFRHLAPRLHPMQVECFWGLYLDAKGRLLHERQISMGTLTASLVHPREVYAPALLHRAASVVVAHNHPSGDPEPSAEDRATTRRLHKAGRLLGVELLDHVILGAGRFVSFQDRGWIS